MPAPVIAFSALTSDIPVTLGTPIPLLLPVTNSMPKMATASSTMTTASVAHRRAFRFGASTGGQGQRSLDVVTHLACRLVPLGRVFLQGLEHYGIGPGWYFGVDS